MDHISRRLVAEGHSVSYVRFDDGYLTEELAVPDGVVAYDIVVPAKRFPWHVWKQERKFGEEFRNWIGAKKPDIVHTNFCLPGNVARRIAMQTKVPGVVTTYHELFGSLNAYLKCSTRRTERNCNRLVYISKTVARSYGASDFLCDTNIDLSHPKLASASKPELDRDSQNTVQDTSDSKHQLIYNGIDVQQIQSFGANAKPVIPQQLIAVGRLVPEKGHALIVKALPKLAEQFPEVKLVLVGEGPQRNQLAMLAKQLGVTEQVEFRGWVPQGEVIATMTQSHCVVLPSIHEGFGLALAEAMLTGRPIVASDIPVFREVASDSGVRYFAENDSEQLATQISGALSDPDEQSQQACATAQRVRENFSSELMAERYLKIYEQLCPKK
ncbi:Glycogen synthase [Rubripirellula lacrimiformis]|uniref:Glycogen synthase n=1 Tax=Rubripirellula lacrimiformis TaxID=1930273 RepID=A0A517N8R3_9BACT|nr:glycosyltransferase family 4 protein [Rubripirellula lacrimiformis]QDT03525.1 Glycogen synthase [Rubripirellula lacrimiformis]